MPKFSIHFAEILSRVHGNFEERNKVLEPSIIIINYCIIINAQYNYYISNKGLFDKCGKEQNVAVIGLLLLPV